MGRERYDANSDPEHRPDIAAACEAIRAGWTDVQRRSRLAVEPREWTVPGAGGSAGVSRRWNGHTMPGMAGREG